MSAVTDLLDQLAAGEVELDAVAEDFRTRAWPQLTRDEPGDATEVFTRDIQDPEERPEGSFIEVAAYYSRHLIDDVQYAALAEAAAEAMKAAPTPGTTAAAVNEGITTP